MFQRSSTYPMTPFSKLRIAGIALVISSTFIVSACSDSGAASYDAALHNAARASTDPVLRTLESLVNIETGTGDAVGMAQMANYLDERLRTLGATVERHAAVDGVVGENIVGKLRGGGTRNILLMAHMDTVYPRGTLAKTPFRIQDGKAYGPGIADDKGGIAVILHTLEVLKAQNFDRYGVITVMFNTDEEKGSFGSRDLIQKLASANDAVLSFEPGGNGFALATSGIGYVEANIKGLAAHAGVAPEAGVNALVEASNLIMNTLDIDDKSKERRFNWTLAKAGTASNTIPDAATLNADVRVGKNEDYAVVDQMLQERALKKRNPAAEVTVKLTQGRPAYNASNDTLTLAQQGVDIFKEIDIQAGLNTTRTGGGSDISYAALSGKPSLEGLGLVGANFHTNQAEYVLIEPIPSRIYLAARMIQYISLR